MGRNGNEIRVIRAKRYRKLKCAIFFTLIFFLFAPVKSSAAALRSGELTITGAVPLQAGFSALLRENSRVKVEERGVEPGRSIRATVELRAPTQPRFPFHSFFVIIRNESQEAVWQAQGVTDQVGNASLEFRLPLALTGRFIIEVVDQNYPEGLVSLSETPHFRISRGESQLQVPRLEEKNVASGQENQSTSLRGEPQIGPIVQSLAKNAVLQGEAIDYSSLGSGP